MESELKTHVSKYLYYKDYIDNVNKQLLKIKKQKKESQDLILEILRKNPSISINIPNGQLEYGNKSKPVPINITNLKPILFEYFSKGEKDSNKITLANKRALDLYNFILENREIKQNEKLVISKLS